ASVASVFVSRWDTALGSLGLGVAMAKRTYAVYSDLLESARWQRLAELGAKPQRLLWASTGVKDPSAPDTLYVTELAAPGTVNTMPEATLLAFGDHGRLDGSLEPDDWAGTEVDVDLIDLAERLQKEGAESFNRSWDELLDTIARKSKVAA